MKKTNELIGLEVDEAAKILTDSGVLFKLISFESEKQKTYDKKLVVAVRDIDGVIELVVTDFKFKLNEGV